MTKQQLPDDIEDAEAAPESPLAAKRVTMTNALTRAAHGLTLAEKRIVMCAVSQLHAKSPVPKESPVVRIHAQDYAKDWGVTANTAYEQLKSASKNLYTRSISFFEPANRRKGAALTIAVKMRWVGEIHYHDGEGWVELHFWHRIVPHLMGIERNFTSYQLQQAGALRSIYSWRLLELLMRFEDKGWAHYDVQDFAMSMGASDKQRADFGKLRAKIIEPAVKELTEKDGWLIDLTLTKAGRKVTGLRFTFERNPQQRLDLEGGKTLVTGRDEGSTPVRAMQQWHDTQREREPQPKPYTIEFESHSVEIIKGQTLKLPVSTTPKTRAKRAAKTAPADLADLGDATQVILKGARSDGRPKKVRGPDASE